MDTRCHISRNLDVQTSIAAARTAISRREMRHARFDRPGHIEHLIFRCYNVKQNRSRFGRSISRNCEQSYQENGTIGDNRRLLIRLNPEKIGWRMTVVVGIRIEKGRLLEIQGKIAKDPRVVSVYDVTGDYDSMVVALARDREDLNNFTKTFFL